MTNEAAHAALCDWDTLPDSGGCHEADVQVAEVGAVAIRVECPWATSGAGGLITPALANVVTDA